MIFFFCFLKVVSWKSDLANNQPEDQTISTTSRSMGLSPSNMIDGPTVFRTSRQF
jgi:hypothetical protein